LAQYYYLVASLPLLFYDTERFPSRVAFLEQCEQHISSTNFRLLAAASITELKPVSPICRSLELWRRWEIALRNELAALRGKAKGVEADAYRLDAPDIIEAQTAAREAFAKAGGQATGAESPLQAEETLNLARWGYLDQLEVGHYFDIDRLVVYVLRLQLLERKALFDEQKGREMFDTVYGEITRPIGDIAHGKA